MTAVGSNPYSKLVDQIAVGKEPQSHGHNLHKPQDTFADCLMNVSRRHMIDFHHRSGYEILVVLYEPNGIQDNEMVGWLSRDWHRIPVRRR
jgi:hypothetical protein